MPDRYSHTAITLHWAIALLIFTNKVSHRARHEALSVAKAQNIPVFQYHSCGVCTLRNCLNCIKST